MLCAGKNETEKKMAPAVNLMLTQNIKLHLRSSFCAVRLALETKLDSIIEKKLKKVYLLVSINKSPEKINVVEQDEKNSVILYKQGTIFIV